jgi:hypothetical protein
LVGTITTGERSPHSFLNARISSGLEILLWIRIASAPARRYASARLRVLSRLDLPAELVHVGERLMLAQEAVGLGEELVLDADARDAAVLELPHEAAHVVEVAVARVAVEQQRDLRGVADELDQVQHLRPAHLVVVADPHGRADGKAAAPEALESRLLGDLRGEPVVALHQEAETVPARQHVPERFGFRGHGATFS